MEKTVQVVLVHQEAVTARRTIVPLGEVEELVSDEASEAVETSSSESVAACPAIGQVASEAV